MNGRLSCNSSLKQQDIPSGLRERSINLFVANQKKKLLGSFPCVIQVLFAAFLPWLKMTSSRPDQHNFIYTLSPAALCFRFPQKDSKVRWSISGARALMHIIQISSDLHSAVGKKKGSVRSPIFWLIKDESRE